MGNVFSGTLETLQFGNKNKTQQTQYNKDWKQETKQLPKQNSQNRLTMQLNKVVIENVPTAARAGTKAHHPTKSKAKSARDYSSYGVKHLQGIDHEDYNPQL